MNPSDNNYRFTEFSVLRWIQGGHRALETPSSIHIRESKKVMMYWYKNTNLKMHILCTISWINVISVLYSLRISTEGLHPPHPLTSNLVSHLTNKYKNPVAPDPCFRDLPCIICMYLDPISEKLNLPLAV